MKDINSILFFTDLLVLFVMLTGLTIVFLQLSKMTKKLSRTTELVKKVIEKKLINDAAHAHHHPLEKRLHQLQNERFSQAFAKKDLK